MPRSDRPRNRSRNSDTPLAVPPIPKRKSGPPPDPGRILLAKIVSTLFGALIGIVVANLVGYFFGGRDFNEDLQQAKRNLETVNQKLDEDQKQIDDIRKQIKLLDNQVKGKAQGDAAVALRAERTKLSSTNRELNSIQANHVATRDTLLSEVETNEDSLTRLNIVSIVAIALLTMLGYMAYPLTLRYIEHSVDTWVAVYAQAERRSQTLLIGFFAGLIISVLVLLALFTTFSTGPLADPIFRLIFGAFFVVALGTAGSLVAVNYFGPGPRRVDPYREFRELAKPKVLDTSVLIDGRVQEVAATGFLDGTLVVTNSVLREMQALADSSDGRKRDKGRRGLELVHTMQEDPRLNVRIFDDSDLHDGARATDDQLIVVAQAMGAAVVTNDYNLNRVAAIRDVQVINLNALANAVKTRHVPGDMIEIHIADRGKQRGQGVGYLEDGTMVVVEDGEPYIRQTRTIKLTSVTQTVQGRLIFGRVDLADEETGNGQR